MPNALNLDDVRLRENLVDDAVIADANPICALGAGKLLRAVRPRVGGKLTDT